MTLTPGTRLGNYEIVAPVGAGGMGEVYRSRDPRLNREVAIKVLSAQLAKDPAAQREVFAISPDNRTIYYGAARAEADIWIVERK